MDDNNEFDMDGALDSITSDLGLTEEAPTDEGTDDLGASPPEPEAQTPPTSAPVSPPAPELPPAPKSWRKEAQEVWATLPETARAEVMKREEDILRGIEEYKGKSAFGERMQAAIQPFQQFFQQTGAQPEQLFNNLMSSHLFLMNGPAEQKAAVFQRLARDYGVDLSGATPTAQPIDPQVRELRQAVMGLNGQLQNMTQAQHKAVFEANLKQVTDFSQSPDHPHFEELAETIGQLLETKVAKNLQEAYDKAVWQNPATREKAIAKITADAEAKRHEEGKKRTEAARRATAANTAARERAGKPTAALGSIDDTLASTLAEIQSRAA